MADALEGGVAWGEAGCCAPFGPDGTRIPPLEEMRRCAREFAGCCGSFFTCVGTATGVPFAMLETADGPAELIEATGGTDGCREEGLGGRMATGSIWGGPSMNGLISPDANFNVGSVNSFGKSSG